MNLMNAMKSVPSINTLKVPTLPEFHHRPQDMLQTNENPIIRCWIERQVPTYMYMIFPPHMSYSDSRPNERTKQNSDLIVEGGLAILHALDTGSLDLLVLALVVSNDVAEIGLRTGGNVVRRAGVHHTAESHC